MIAELKEDPGRSEGIFLSVQMSEQALPGI